MVTGTVSPSFCPCCVKPSIGFQLKPTQSFVCVSSLFYASFDVVIPVCVQSQLRAALSPVLLYTGTGTVHKRGCCSQLVFIQYGNGEIGSML